MSQTTPAAAHLRHLKQPLHANFVAPILCKDLVKLGVNVKTIYEWKIKNGDAFIYTTAFDPDGYYGKAETLLDEQYCTEVLPAFQVCDIEKAIGDFVHVYKNKMHMVIDGDKSRLIHESSPRYSDALALVLIKKMDLNLLTPSQVVDAIIKQTE